MKKKNLMTENNDYSEDTNYINYVFEATYMKALQSFSVKVTDSVIFISIS